ncbi:MAG: peptidoglycan DD-metalloendopeptidase family protein [Pseudomonadota bacterium]
MASARFHSLLILALLLAGCSNPLREPPTTHIVRSGETLFSIAFRYGKDPDDVARWNRLGDGSLIYPGQKLRLVPPTGSSRASSRQAPKPLPELPSQPPPTWSWPTDGRINVNFGGKPGPGTGVLIDGKTRQAVRAAASGTVVYAGSGLIGYGQLIIIKHNDTYLSAYGYTASVLVREGESVRRGQPIARMGEGPERKPRLHFEIRRNGKPVNPRQFLPAR